MGAAAIVIVILLCRFLLSRKAKKDYAPFIKTADNSSPPAVCPVCRSPLPKGGYLGGKNLPRTCSVKETRLFTKVFRPMDVHDQHCVVYGCPQCYAPSISRFDTAATLTTHRRATMPPPHSKDRLCPVCHKAVPPDGYLVARLFNQTKSGKKHLTVTGCPQCARMGE